MPDSHLHHDLLIFLVFSIILLSVSFVVLELWNQRKNLEPPTMAFCAVVDPVSEIADTSLRNSLLRGKALFRENCAICHARQMDTDLTGPALGGVQQRWSAYPAQDLYRWIREPDKMIEEKHPRAEMLWEEWKPTKMISFGFLTDAEIEGILNYIAFEHKVR